MKNFFKKLSFVLALAMVLTSIAPASASAATTNYIAKKGSKQASTVYVFIGGSKCDLDYSDASAEGTWKSADETIATVDKDGVVTPVANGKVKISFVSKSGKTLAKQTVRVCTRAAKLNIYDFAEYAAGTKNVLNGSEYAMKLGEKRDLQITMPISAAKKAAGAKSSSYASYCVGNTDNGVVAVTKVNDRQYTLEAKAAGESTITIAANQTSEANVLKGTKFVKAEVKVVVKSTEITAEQTKYNTFTLTFGDAETAKAAATKTADSLTQGNAAVTENKEIVKVFLNEENGEKISAFIGEITVKDEVVTVKMFDDLHEGKTYTVEYMDKKVEFVACKWIPVALGNTYTYTPNPDEANGGTANLIYTIYATGEKGQKVDITDKVRDLGAIEYKDTAVTPDYTKYSVAGEQVDFYVNKAVVNVKATFTWYDATAGNAEKVLENTFEVTTTDNRQYKILAYEVTTTPTTYIPAAVSTAKFCCTDPVSYLLVKIGVDNDGDLDFDDEDPIYETYATAGDNATVTFKSANVDKLNVDEKFGTLYAPKPVDANINVYVYYKDKYVGAVPVEVNAQRKLASLEILPLSDGKYSYSEADRWNTRTTYAVTDAETFKITAKDQFGAPYNDVTIDVFKTTDVLDGSIGCTNAGVQALVKGNTVGATIGNADVLSFTATTTSTAVKTVQYKVTVTENETNKKISQVFSFTVKNTTNDTITSTKIEKNFDGSFSVFGMSSAGYKVCGYKLAPYAADYTGDFLAVDIIKVTNGKSIDYTVAADQKSVSMTTQWTATDTSISKVVNPSVDFFSNVTGAAVTTLKNAAKQAGQSTVYLDNGTYQVKAFEYRAATRKLVVKAAMTTTHANSVPTDTFVWKSAYSENTGALTVFDESFRINVQTKEPNPVTGVPEWTVTLANTGKVFSDITAQPYVVSYVENTNGGITYLNMYRLMDDGHVVVTPIMRTVYTNVQK